MYQVLLLLVTTLCAAQASSSDNSIVDVALTIDGLSTFVKAVTAGGLAKALEGPGPFTVFAPTNAAFEALPAGVLTKLLANKAALDEVLLYHVLGNEVFSRQLLNNSKLQNLEKKYVSVRLEGTGIFIVGLNSAKVLIPDIEASNGVIHIIDAVLFSPLPPTPPTLTPSIIPTPAPTLPLRNESIVDAAMNFDGLSTFVKAVTAGGLAKTLEGPGPFTVFAPTNTAFEALPAGVLTKLLANKAALDEVLLYHVLGYEVLSRQLLNNSKLRNLEKKYVTVRLEGTGIFIVGFNSAKILIADIQASNGVIHIIDAVLFSPLPPTLPPTLPPSMFPTLPPSIFPTPAPTTPSKPNIVQLAEGAPQLSTLVKYLIEAKLVKTLEGAGPFTVFAPTNAAFERGPFPVTVDLLKFHVVAGDVHAKDIFDGELIRTLEGKYVQAAVNSSGVFLNNAKVTIPDLDASNGVVHVINEVLRGY